MIWQWIARNLKEMCVGIDLVDDGVDELISPRGGAVEVSGEDGHVP